MPKTESKSALLEAAQAAIAEQRVKAQSQSLGPGRTSTGRSAMRILLAVGIIVGIGILVARPIWLLGPPLPPEPQAVRAASAVLVLVRDKERVESFRAKYGRLPDSLDEVGIGTTHLQYHRVSDTEFTLAVPAADSLVTLRSTDSLKPIVVQALRVLQRRPRS